jgi:hypothetical protein
MVRRWRVTGHFRILYYPHDSGVGVDKGPPSLKHSRLSAARPTDHAQGGVVEAVVQCLQQYKERPELLAHGCAMLSMLAHGGVHRFEPVPADSTPARRGSAAAATSAVLLAMGSFPLDLAIQVRSGSTPLRRC